MARRDGLVIHIASGEPRTGIWCDGCLTTAAIEIDVYRLVDDGLRLLTTARACPRCREDQSDGD